MSVGARTVDRATAGQLPEKIGNLLHESRWLALGALALYLAMAFWGFSKDDPGWSHAVVSSQLHNPTGHAGAWIADLMLYLFGLSAWWWIVLLLMFMWWGFRRLNSPLGHVDRRPLYIALSGFALLLVASSALEALRFHSLKADLPLGPGGLLGIEVGRLLEHLLGYTGSTLVLLAAIAGGWSIFSGMSWLWAFERLGDAIESFGGFFFGLLDTWRDRRIGREVAQQREDKVEVEKRRVELHDPIIIETPPPEVPVSKKAEKRIEREKQVVLFPEAIIGGQLPPFTIGPCQSDARDSMSASGIAAPPLMPLPLRPTPLQPLLEAIAEAKQRLHPVQLFAVGYAVKTSRSETLDSIRILADNNMYKNKLKTSRAMKVETIRRVVATIETVYEKEKGHLDTVSTVSLFLSRVMYSAGLASAAKIHF